MLWKFLLNQASPLQLNCILCHVYVIVTLLKGTNILMWSYAVNLLIKNYLLLGKMLFSMSQSYQLVLGIMLIEYWICVEMFYRKFGPCNQNEERIEDINIRTCCQINLPLFSVVLFEKINISNLHIMIYLQW